MLIGLETSQKRIKKRLATSAAPTLGKAGQDIAKKPLNLIF
jgi:hypothetical protein